MFGQRHSSWDHGNGDAPMEESLETSIGFGISEGYATTDKQGFAAVKKNRKVSMISSRTEGDLGI